MKIDKDRTLVSESKQRVVILIRKYKYVSKGTVCLMIIIN